MPKKRPRRQRRKGFEPRRKPQIVVAIVVTVSLLAAWTMLASFGALDSAFREKGSRDATVSSASFNSNSPSKEYIYAGSKLVATDEPTGNGNNAQFVSMSYREPCTNVGGGPIWLPIVQSAFGLPVQNYTVKVTMKNTGSDEWPAGDYFLGSQNPPNNENWGAGKNRIALPTSVLPNATVDFEFSVKRPSGGGNFQWQMVQGPVSTGVFFGQMTTNVVLPGGSWLCSTGAPSNYATFVSQSVPEVMVVGQTYSLSITMNNGGAKTWLAGTGFKLGSQFPQDNFIWGLNRVALPSSTSPAQNVTFVFFVTAPATPGEYNCQWMMLLESETEQEWFGFVTPTTFVKVTAP